jgi:hypothetical protein
MLLSLALVGSLTLAPGGNRISDSIPALEHIQPTLESTALVMPRVVAPSGGVTLSNVALSNPAATSAEPDPSSPQLVDYSDGYFKRLEVHKWVSIAMIPLFAGDWIVGQKMYNGDSSRSLRHAHQIMAMSTLGLFGVNTVTGVWNLLEARHDPDGRTRRTLHGALMLLADAGFVATSLTGHGNRTGAQSGFNFHGVRNLKPHRNLAIASMATAMVSIAIMIPPFRKN